MTRVNVILRHKNISMANEGLIQRALVVSVGYQACVKLLARGLVISFIIGVVIVFPAVDECVNQSTDFLLNCTIMRIFNRVHWRIAIFLQLVLQCLIPLICGHVFISKIKKVAPMGAPVGLQYKMDWKIWLLITPIIALALFCDYVLNFWTFIQSYPNVWRFYVLVSDAIWVALVHYLLGRLFGLRPNVNTRMRQAPIGTAARFNNMDISSRSYNMSLSRNKPQPGKAEAAQQEMDEARRDEIDLLFYNVDCRFSVVHITSALVVRFWYLSRSVVINDVSADARRIILAENENLISSEAIFFVWTAVLIQRGLQFGVELLYFIFTKDSTPTPPEYVMDFLRSKQSGSTVRNWMILYILYTFATCFGWRNPFVSMIALLVFVAELTIQWVRRKVIGAVPQRDGAYIPWFITDDMNVTSWMVLLTAVTTMPLFDFFAFAPLGAAVIFIVIMRYVIQRTDGEFWAKVITPTSWPCLKPITDQAKRMVKQTTAS